ncbi:hypothetical protein HUU62_07505 [Rhodoferax sp. 4810]|nr:hypothetical protein [Rhodoferax jenense]
MRTRIVLLSACLAMSGCAVPVQSPPVFHLSAHYDEAQALRLLQDGTNTIKGSAFMRQRGGGVVTCAGQIVNLVPATEYARQRVLMGYGSSESGFNNSRRGVFEPDIPAYKTNVRTTKCDAQGSFIFDRVADGEFFVVTTITWSVGYSQQGGNLMHRVTVKNNQFTTIVLSS